MININIDTSQLDKKLIDLKSKVPVALRAGVERSLVVIGNLVKNRATDAFKNPALRPSPWAPRKNNADPGRPLLYKSGDLMRNFRSVVTGPGTVVVGTKVKYARYHQHGTKKMPARPFLPVDKSGQLTPDCMREIKEEVEKSVAEELGKFGLK